MSKTTKHTRYYVTTWDSEKQAFTPQNGVRTGPWSKWGLRRAIRKLRELGYTAHYRRDAVGSHDDNDPSVAIDLVEDAT